MAIRTKSKKYFLLKTYDASTGEYIDTFHSKEFSDVLDFSASINGGLSAMRLQTSLGFKEWTQSDGRLAGLESGQKAKFFVFDEESGKMGKQVYSGIFSGIDVQISGAEENIILNFLPNTIFLAKRVLRDADNKTSVDYQSQDPADIIKNIVYQANTDIGYDETTILDTGLSRTYSFTSAYSLEAINKVIDILPTGWFFFVGGDDKVYLRNHDSGNPDFTYWGAFNWGEGYWKYDPATDSTFVHEINMMNQVKKVNINKNMSDMVNRVLFLGGGSPQLFKQYDFTGSQDKYGLYEHLYTDERVTVENTAESFSKRILGNNQLPETKIIAEIIDSNFYQYGYDIESLKVGEKIRINTDLADENFTYWSQFNWGEDYWKYSIKAFFGVPYFIKKIYYKFHTAVVEMEIQPEGISKRIEDVNRDLTSYRFKDAPDIPDNI